MTIETRLAEIRARAENATPGPWEDVVDDLNEDVDVYHDREYRLWIANTGNLFTASAQLARQTRADAEFIAASRTDVPSLLAAVQAVMDLHRPGRTFHGHGFSTPLCTCGAPLPCPTVQAITTALEVQG